LAWTQAIAVKVFVVLFSPWRKIREFILSVGYGGFLFLFEFIIIIPFGAV
jgi:hypothetical protein